MIIHELVQGTPLWHTYRSEMLNASDAPAMLGLSKYKTRTQLLNERKSGLTPDIDSATQKLFDDGHKFEALARPLAEKIIGEELSPVTGSEGNLSASFDGLTFMNDIAFEHKTLNDELRAVFADIETRAPEYRENSGDLLPMMYQVQMQQQLMVSGAEKCLFMATSWNAANQLIEEKHTWYLSNKEVELKIVEGWGQFQIDLENHVVAEAKQAPKAQAIMALPTLAIAIKGEVTQSNLVEFKDAATVFISNIKTELVSDQDFADAESMTKFLDDAEKNIESAKTAAIAQTSSIDELMRTMDFIKNQLRDKRLTLEKLVKFEKENRKNLIVKNVNDKFTKTLKDLSVEILPISLSYPSFTFADALKNKKTLASMEDSADTMRAEKEAMINAIATDIRAKLTWYKEFAMGYEALFADLQSIIYKPADDFQLVVKTRIESAKKAEEDRIAKAKEKEALAIAQAQYEAELVKPVEIQPPVIERNVFKQSPVLVEANYPPKPSTESIVMALASAYKVGAEVALEWLQVSDFSKVNFNKQAS